ncbi:MAG: penicillin acylase family protein, partial [Myxococcota bacterium]
MVIQTMTTSTRHSMAWMLLALLGPLGAFGCGDDGDDDGDGIGDPELAYSATVRWTGAGVPHILADDIPSAAFGQGYAFARLNGCVMADQAVKLRSERSQYFGPGPSDAHIDSDFYHLHLGVMDSAQASYDSAPAAIRDLLDGYASGFNEYVATQGEALPCAGEPWLQPITPVEFMAHYVELATLASARALAPGIVTAQPPGSGLSRSPGQVLKDVRPGEIGSNGWAIGAERSAGGGGMLLANPHFPWEGELKLYESHLRVPGQLDAYGASLL